MDYRDPSAVRIDVRPVALTELQPGFVPDRLVLDPSAAGGTAEPREDARLLRVSTVLGMKIEHPHANASVIELPGCGESS